MNDLEKLRARLGVITARLEEISAMENPGDAEVIEMAELTSEFEAAEEKITALERTAAVLAKAKAGNRQVSATSQAAQAGSSNVTVLREAKDRFGGFNNTSEYLTAVKAASGGKVHQVFQGAMYEKNGEDGGYLIPQEMQEGILKKFQTQESLWQRARTFNVGSNNLTITVDENAPWTGGVVAKWLGEGKPLTESKPNFKQASFRLHKIGAFVIATDELLDDATALESYIKQNAPDAIIHAVNNAMISGDGIAKPQGILNSPFKFAVDKESAQAADTIVARNVIKMYSRMIPIARAGAVWLINPQIEEQLYTMKDDLGNFIYLAPGSQMNSSPYGFLMGRPVLPLMSAVSALGDEGDIIFANFDYYYGIQKSGIKQAQSIHLYFDKEQTAFRFTMRLDGKVPFTSPITTQKGAHQMSAFVTLKDRA